MQCGFTRVQGRFFYCQVRSIQFDPIDYSSSKVYCSTDPFVGLQFQSQIHGPYNPYHSSLEYVGYFINYHERLSGFSVTLHCTTVCGGAVHFCSVHDH